MRRWRSRKMDMRVPREALAGIAAVLAAMWLWGGGGSAEGAMSEAPIAEVPVMPVPSRMGFQPSRGTVERGSMPAEVRIDVYDADVGQAMELDLEAYIRGVVAAEMPASYEAEALRAQAVAARTYAFRQIRARGGPGCSRGEGADVCTSPSCCQAYDDEAALRERWGGEYELYRDKIAEAVSATRGELVTYAGQPIHALFHAVSGGRTEDAIAVFNMDLPYLTSVESDGEEDAPRYQSKKTISRVKLAQALNDAYPKAQLAASKLPGQIEILSRLRSGQVERVRVNKTTITGAQFRAAAGIDSANFGIGYDEENAVIRTQGFGHGVGMSQAGANAMAKEGSGYREILAHYYAGTRIMGVGEME